MKVRRSADLRLYTPSRLSAKAPWGMRLGYASPAAALLRLPPGSLADAPLRLFQGVVKVVDKVIYVLQADREA